VKMTAALRRCNAQADPGGMCFCVDTATGQRLNAMSRPHMVPAGERDMLNCTEGELQFTAL